VRKMFIIFCERLPHAIFMRRLGQIDDSPSSVWRYHPEPSSASYEPTDDEAVPKAPPAPKAPPPPAPKAPPPPMELKAPSMPPLPTKRQSLPIQAQWKTERDAREAAVKPAALLIAGGPAVRGDWVQLSHGGIEPRFNPRPLLQSEKEFAVTGAGRTFEGLNWSDWTGVEHVSSEPFSRADPRGGMSGYCCDMRDTHFYTEHVGIRAFFRGHQDTDVSLKLVVRSQHDVVPWDFNSFTRCLLGGDETPPCSRMDDDGTASRPPSTCVVQQAHTRRELAHGGVCLSRFLGSGDTVPVFTFSCCTEARALRDEGFGIVRIGPTLDEWVVSMHIYDVARVAGTDETWTVYTAGSTEPFSVFATKEEAARLAPAGA
jgi:hypothetical protein